MKELNGTAFTVKEIGRRRSVPVVYLQGSHYEVGFDVGRNFGSLIKNFIATFDDLRDFEKQYQTRKGREAYDMTLLNMKQKYPHYVKEMQGIADGANVSFHQLFLLHLDDIIETINDRSLARNDTGGCTSLAIKTQDNGILGHTEDALTPTLNHWYIMSAHIIPTPEDREQGAVEERFASLCYAGQFPGYTSGYNEHGLVFSINTLSPAVLKPGATPRTFITRALLASKNYADAERILIDEGLGAANGFSLNMIWSDIKGNRNIYNVEVSPNLSADRSAINVHHYNKDVLMHCNRYLRLPVNESDGRMIDSSTERMKTIKSYPTPQTKEDIAKILSDTTNKRFPIFEQEPDSDVQTIAASMFDLNEMTWSLYINKPSESEPVAILPLRFSMLKQ
ncbi:beta-alanyl-dopamine/carcinine hydrolase isoform X3 [Epargyreus clarus]|uniref:beta-alanyl-dopamine/carcinine hydrolase isoform X3 n=1 Tax=Epargyreus clarus TaxID=520877 RepID=UPI003C2F511E